MLSQFNDEAKNILMRAKEEMFNLKHPYIGSEHLLLALLKNKNEISKRLKEYKIDYNLVLKEIKEIIGVGTNVSEWFLYTPLLKRIIENASMDSRENNDGIVTVNHLFASLLEEGEGVAIRLLLGLKVDIDELYNDFSYKLIKTSKNKLEVLDELGNDLTKAASLNKLDPVIGRDEEVRRLIEILSRRTKNNPILIGEAGVGKTAIVEQLAQLIINNDVPKSLMNKRIISLDISSTVAGTKYRGEFEERIKKILKEVDENEDIILFIDEIHTIVGAGGAEGAIDASNIFKPALARNKLRLIGATTIDEYKKHIEKDSALERRFQKIIIEQPDDETLKDILINLKPIYESYHNVLIDNNLIDLIIQLSNKYIYDRKQPDKSIDILDEVCAKVSLKESKKTKDYNLLLKSLKNIEKEKKDLLLKNKFKQATFLVKEENELKTKINSFELKNLNKAKKVNKLDIANVIEKKTNISIYELLDDKKMVVKKVKNDLEKNFIGQDSAIKELINIVKKIKFGLNDSCYSFFFCGPTGVGKTSIAKYFGKSVVGDKNVIKLDMSEYSDSSSINKILGSSPGYVGYDDNLNVLEEVKNKPNSVIILDEIEKASSKVIDLFLQILEEGKIKDSKGKIVRFDKCILIFTSNIGFNENMLGFNKSNLIVLNKLKEYFTIPFINRIDNLIIFNKLKEEDVRILIKNKLNNVIKKDIYNDIDIKYNKDIINKILELSNYNEFGARKIDKIIKDYVETLIIENMLENNNKINIKNI